MSLATIRAPAYFPKTMSSTLLTTHSQAERPPIILPLIVACALFMENLDSTIIATALPAMARSLGESPLTMSAAMTSYLLSLVVFIPASGWLADRFGGRDVFVSAIAVFTISSLLCGVAQNLPEMIAARVLQGMGGAMMTPVGRLVLLRAVSKSQLVQAMSYVTIPALVGPAIGPLIGGFIATYSTWRWIFYVNLPIGLLGIALALRFIPNVRMPDPGRADIRGLVLTGLGLGFLALTFDNIGRGALPGWLVAIAAAIGLFFLALFLRHARQAERPAIDLTLLRLPTYRASILGGNCFRMAIGGTPFLLPLMFQLGFGLTPLQSGSLTFASAVGAMGMKAIAPPIVRRFGFRQLLVGNAALCTLSLASYGLFRPSWPYALIIGALLLGGLIRSLQFTCINAIGYADVPPARMSRATSLSSAAQQLTLSIGVTIAATLLALVKPSHATASLAPADFLPVFLAMSVFCLASIFFFAALPHGAGAEVSRACHRAPAPEAD
ncbi:MAG TPA: DHA2 family efflux MFS transporter permease subunit [Dongiaceae bacterium]|nr:DHA2 family efflux MFS transporter permease subunit [Dongiaceae bacterium]